MFLSQCMFELRIKTKQLFVLRIDFNQLRTIDGLEQTRQLSELYLAHNEVCHFLKVGVYQD